MHYINHLCQNSNNNKKNDNKDKEFSSGAKPLPICRLFFFYLRYYQSHCVHFRSLMKDFPRQIVRQKYVLLRRQLLEYRCHQQTDLKGLKIYEASFISCGYKRGSGLVLFFLKKKTLCALAFFFLICFFLHFRRFIFWNSYIIPSNCLHYPSCCPQHTTALSFPSPSASSVSPHLGTLNSTSRSAS